MPSHGTLEKSFSKVNDITIGSIALVLPVRQSLRRIRTTIFSFGTHILLLLDIRVSAVRSVSICVRERQRAFGNLAIHS